MMTGKLLARFGRKPAPSLMLTSLLDMFTIILIFLIVSFEAESYEVKMRPGLELPSSSARSLFKPAANLLVGLDGVQVGDEQVVAWREGRAAPADYEAGEISGLIAALEAALASAEAVADGDEEPILLVQSDRRVDYRTLHLCLRSAAVAGFFKYRLVVMKQ